jgi:hypothetical protein
MRARKRFLASGASVFVAVSFGTGLLAADAQKNTTGLPTYPRDSRGTMDAVVRSIPNGQHCSHYSSHTADALATVIDWYRKALPTARVEDVNKDSLYGSYFKLEGVKLLAGNDIVNVYRMPKGAGGAAGRTPEADSTQIEIFKCNDAPLPARDD